MLSFLRKVLQRQTVNSLWQTVQARPIESKADCPFCRNGMKTVIHLLADGEDGRIEVDLCTLCPAVWFDTHELEVLGRYRALPPEPLAPRLPPKAREILALAEIERIREKADQDETPMGLP
ncbi:MAG: hypothetical protein ACKOAL_12035, partial [Chthoniobacterales bacterium]